MLPMSMAASLEANENTQFPLSKKTSLTQSCADRPLYSLGDVIGQLPRCSSEACDWREVSLERHVTDVR